MTTLSERGNADRAAAAAPERRTLRRHEVAWAALLFTALSFAVFGWYAFHGGFIADDWVNARNYYFPSGGGFWGAVANYQTPSRPVAAFWVSLTYAVLGTHTHLHLVLSVLLAAFLSTAFFAFLRTLGVELAMAIAAAALLLVFPSSDSTRLWTTGSQIDLFIGLYLVAAVIAVRGIRRHGPEPTRAAVATQGLASLLAVVAVAGYEIVAPAVLLSFLLYGWVDRRGARWRWLMDAVPTLLVLIFFTSKFGGGAAHGTQLLTNVKLVAEGGVGTLGYSLVPVRSASRWAVLAGLAALVAAMLLAVRLGRASRSRDAMASWLKLLLPALAGVAVGYLMLIPAADRYPIYAPGVQNRTNCFAALGLSFFVVCVAGGIGSLLAAAAPRLTEAARGRLRAVVMAVLVVGILGIYSVRVNEDVDRWTTAAREQIQVLDGAHHFVPSPPRGSTIFTSPVAGYSSPSVPIFGGGGNNDELGAFKVSYGTAGVRAFPLLRGNGVRCGRTEISTPDSGRSPTPYGRAILVDLRAQRVYRPTSQAACLRDVDAMRPLGKVNLSEAW